MPPAATSVFPDATAENPSHTAAPLPASHQSPITDYLTPLAAAIPYLPILWLVGAPLTFTLLVAGPAFDACQRMRTALRITRRVALAACDGVAQPVLVGVFRPLILLPTAALAGWTPEQLDMILLHELAHVRRSDNLVNLLQRIVESLLFYHPAVWILSRQVRHDREECCDATVIRHTDRPHQYAELLVSIAAALRGGPAPSLAVASAMASHPLASRIRRILNIEAEPMRITRRTLAATLLLPALLAGAILYSGANAEDGSNPPPSKGGAGGGIPDASQPNTLASDKQTQGGSADAGGILDANEPNTPASDKQAKNEGARKAVMAAIKESVAKRREVIIECPEAVRNSDEQLRKTIATLDNAGYPARIVDVQAFPTATVRGLAVTVPADLKWVVVWDFTNEPPTPRVLDRNEMTATGGVTKIASDAPPSDEAHIPSRPSQPAMTTINYVAADLDAVNFHEWMNLVASDSQITVKWLPQNKSFVVTANPIGHQKVREFLNRSRSSRGDSHAENPNDANSAQADAPHANPEIAELQTKIRNIEAAIRQTQDEITNLEVFKKLVQQQLPSDALIDEVVSEALKDDPRLESLEQRLLSIEEGIAAEELNLAKESSDNDSDTLKRLRKLRETAEVDRKIYLSEATKTIRDRIAKPGKEAIDASATEYKIRRKATDEKLADYQQELDAARRRLSQLGADVHIPTLQGEIHNLEALVAKAQQEIVNLEVYKQIGGHGRHPGSSELDQAIAEELEKDPTINELRQKLFEQQTQLQKQLAESKTPNSSPIKKLRSAVQLTEAELAKHAQQLQQSLRRKLAHIPADEKAKAEAEYIARYQAAKDNLAKHQQELEAARLKLSQLGADSAPAQPQPSASRTPSKAVGTFDEATLKKLFESRPDNPILTVNYALDQLPPEQYEDPWSDIFDGMKLDPYGPQLAFEHETAADKRHMKITAPVQAHREFFETFFSGELLKGELAAPKQKSPGLVKEILINFLPELSKEDHQRILQEIKATGLSAMITTRERQRRTSAAGKTETASAPYLSVLVPKTWQAKPVWETRSNGEKTLRIINEAGGPGSPNQGGAATRSPHNDAQAVANASPGSAAPVQEPELPAPSLENPKTDDPRLANLLPLTAKDFASHFIISPDNQLSEYSYEVDPDMLPAIRERLDAALDLLRTSSNPTPKFVVNYRGANFVTIIAAERAQHSLLVDQTTGRPAAGLRRVGRSYSSPATHFPSLEHQRLADSAYKLLGLELEPLNPEDLERVKKLGYTGGLRIASVAGEEHVRFMPGDILVGLHAWPVTDLKSLDAVFNRDDLGELNPLKYYVARNQDHTGQFGNIEPIEDRVVTGRLEMNPNTVAEHYRERSNRRLSTDEAGSPGSPNPGGAATRGSDNAAPPAANASPGAAAPVQEPPSPATSRWSDFATVQVLQPPKSTKAGLLGGGSMTTAYLKIKRDGQSRLFPSATERITPQEIEERAIGYLKLIKSTSLLKAALEIAPTQQIDVDAVDPVEWLRKRLSATFPGDGEVLELRLTGVIGDEDEKILQAIIDCFIAELQVPPESPANPAATAASEPTFLYDGKTFEQWRDLWKLELNPKRRVEAITALTSFSRAGRGREAADAVFEVASQYDFGKSYSNEEDEVKFIVIKLCTDGYGNQLATADWIPALEKVLKQDPKQNKTLAVWLLQQMQDTSDEAKAALQTLAANDDPEIRAAAEEARTWPETLLAELMKADANGDQQLDEQEAAATKRLYKGQLMSLDKNQDQQLSEDELQSAIPQYLNRRTGMGGGGGGMSGGARGGFF